MGGLISCNKKIDDMRFVDLDHRPKEAECALMVQECVVIKFKDGTFWSSMPRRIGEHAYVPGDSHWTRPLLNALRALKVINSKDIKEHLELCEKRAARLERDCARHELKRLAEKHGFQISAEQKKVLKFEEEVKKI